MGSMSVFEKEREELARNHAEAFAISPSWAPERVPLLAAEFDYKSGWDACHALYEEKLAIAIGALKFADKACPKGRMSIIPQKALQFVADTARAALEKLRERNA